MGQARSDASRKTPTITSDSVWPSPQSAPSAAPRRPLAASVTRVDTVRVICSEGVADPDEHAEQDAG